MARKRRRPVVIAPREAGSAGDVMLDAPASLAAQENLEPDAAPSRLDHIEPNRTESLETDASTSAIDHAIPSAAPTSPDGCSEPDAEPVTSDDLH